MKKLYFIPLLLLTLVIGVNKVNADTNSNVFTANNFYDNYSYLPSIVSNYSNEIDTLVSYYNTNYSQYPNYVIDYLRRTDSTNHDYIILRPTSDNYIYVQNATYYPNMLWYNYIQLQNSVQLSFVYDITANTFKYNIDSTGLNYALSYWLPISTKQPYTFHATTYDKLILPSYTNNDLDVSYPSYELFDGDELPTYMTLSGGSYDTYHEINLNDYEYVILSLKDYNQDPFWTNIYTLGRLCLTPVYNYGMTQKQDIMPGSQNQGCSTTYEIFTPVNISILSSDISNHAVYYVSAYQNETTKIKVNTSVFDITYITSQNADSPQVVIGGRSYPVIPYSNLTDTANISTSQGFVSGQVCSLGDMNCVLDANNISSFSDIFTHPLETLQSVWLSVVNIFAIITAFITLLPPTLQTFLYASFMLAVILGLIKIIL